MKSSKSSWYVVPLLVALCATTQAQRYTGHDHAVFHPPAPASSNSQRHLPAAPGAASKSAVRPSGTAATHPDHRGSDARTQSPDSLPGSKTPSPLDPAVHP